MAMNNGNYAHAYNNVISEGHSMLRGNNACSEGGLCTGAVWGIQFLSATNPDKTLQSFSNIISKLSESDTEIFPTGLPRIFDAFQPGSLSDEDIRDTILYKWDSTTQGVEAEYSEPERDLGSYYQHLLDEEQISETVGEDNYDSFMNLAKSRKAGIWYEHLEARAINNYIRAGFEIEESTETCPKILP